MVALAIGQALQAAWILQPVSGDLYLGSRGEGVRRITAEGIETRTTIPDTVSGCDTVSG